jgi:hypothetical protein
MERPPTRFISLIAARSSRRNSNDLAQQDGGSRQAAPVFCHVHSRHPEGAGCALAPAGRPGRRGAARSGSAGGATRPCFSQARSVTGLNPKALAASAMRISAPLYVPGDMGESLRYFTVMRRSKPQSTRLSRGPCPVGWRARRAERWPWLRDASGRNHGHRLEGFHRLRHQSLSDRLEAQVAATSVGALAVLLGPYRADQAQGRSKRKSSAESAQVSVKALTCSTTIRLRRECVDLGVGHLAGVRQPVETHVAHDPAAVARLRAPAGVERAQFDRISLLALDTRAPSRALARTRRLQAYKTSSLATVRAPSAETGLSHRRDASRHLGAASTYRVSRPLGDRTV